MSVVRNAGSMFNRTHGIRATYVDGCRCDECRSADREYKQKFAGRVSAEESRDQELDRFFDQLTQVIVDRRAAWRNDAACRGNNPDVFFPERGAVRDVNNAKRLCETCPVADECHEYARSINQRSGIWAGVSMNRHVRANPIASPCRVCGTTFVPRGTQCFCSDECRTIGRKKSRRRPRSRR